MILLSPYYIYTGCLASISLPNTPLWNHYSPGSHPFYFEWNWSYSPFQTWLLIGLNHSSEQWWLVQERAHNPLQANEKEAILRLNVVVQSLSHVQLLVTPRTAACQASLSLAISWSLNKFMSTESEMLSNHLPSIFPSIGETQSRICKRDPLSPPGRCSIWIWVCSCHRHLVTIRGVWSCRRASCKHWKLSHR